MQTHYKISGVRVTTMQRDALIALSESLEKFQFDGLSRTELSILKAGWITRDWTNDKSGQTLVFSELGKTLVQEIVARVT